MAEKRYYWLKLKEDFFEEDTIAWLEEQRNGKDYCLFYLKLCLKSLKSNGILIRNVGQILVPYDAKKLAEITNTSVDTVIVALELFQKIGLIQILENGEIYISQLSEMVGSESKWAKYKRNKKPLENIQTDSNDIPKKLQAEQEQEQEIEKEQDIEQEIEQEIEQQQDIDKILKNYYSDREIKIIKKYCADNNVAAAVVKEKLFVLLHKKNIKNKVGSLIAAIKDDWQLPKELESKNEIDAKRFNNFEARDYDYDDLENKLLGWDKDDE